MAFAETQDLAVRLSLKDALTGPLRGVVRDLRGIDRATGRTQRSIGKFGRNIELGALAAAGGLLATVKAASDYESAFAGVRKTVDATEPQLQELSKAFRDLAKTIPISAAELARLGEAGGALGVPIEQMEEFVRVTALLGVTTDLTADEAANSLGILGNVLHLTGEEYDNFASSLVALGNAGASTESQIVAIAERAGAAGELIGVSTEAILGFSSAVASLGIEAEAGGTALQKFFIDSAKQIAKGGDELNLFAKVAGKSAKAFQKAFEKDAGGALQDFLAGLGKLSQGEQLRVLEELGFNDARITRTLLGLANNTKLVADQQQIANDAFREGTALTKEAEERFKTFDSALQLTKNHFTEIGIVIGSKLLPKLTPLLQRLNAFVTENQGAIEQFGTDLAGGFERFADAVGKTDWTPFIDGLKLSASLAKGAFDAFNALPDDFKKLILVGAGINKVTGGLITSIGKDVAGALGAQFLSRGAHPGNPLFVKEVGLPGTGTGPGGVVGGGGKGGVAGAVGLLSKVFIVGMAADVASTLSPLANQAGADLHNLIFQGPLEGVGDALEDFGRTLNNLPWPFGPKNTPTILPELFGGNGLLGGTGAAPPPAPPPTPIDPKLLNVTNERLESIKGYTRTAAEKAPLTVAAIDRAEGRQATRDETIRTQIATATNIAKGDSLSERTAITNASIAQTEAQRQSKQAIAQKIADGTSETRAVASAVRAKKLAVTTNVNVSTSVSVRDHVTAQNRVNSIYRVAS